MASLVPALESPKPSIVLTSNLMGCLFLIKKILFDLAKNWLIMFCKQAYAYSKITQILFKKSYLDAPYAPE